MKLKIFTGNEYILYRYKKYKAFNDKKKHNVAKYVKYN